MPFFISKACTKCSACLHECPTGSIIEGSDRYIIDVDTCADHAACVSVCPVDAIHKVKQQALHEAKDQTKPQTKTNEQPRKK